MRVRSRAVNESLVRRLAVAVVDALKAHGHILVVEGGAEALVRELVQLMSGPLAAVGPHLGPRAPLVGEVTSTFGHEDADEIVEEMVGGVTHALMESDHVEDVFAEDNVIRRDVFRVTRDTLLAPPPPEEEPDDEGEGAISVRLDELGYVAKAVAARAEAALLRDALERAAEAVDAELEGYEPSTREAVFSAPGGGPDRRLELEETVADELADLVDVGIVELPTIERDVALVRPVDAAERKALRPRIDVASTRTLVRSGCGVTWEHVGTSTIRVTFTPLSDHDARELEPYLVAFGRDVNTLLAEAAPPAVEPAPATRRPVTLADAASELLRRAGRAAEAAEVAPKKKPVAKKAAGERVSAPKQAADDEAPAKSTRGDAPAKKPAKKAPAKKASADAVGDAPAKKAAKKPAKRA
jgi:hypothetical protein